MTLECLACGKDKPWRDDKDFCLDCTKILANYINANRYMMKQYPNGISIVRLEGDNKET